MALALDARRAHSNPDVDVNDDIEDSARDRLVELEFIAGVETTEDDRQRRMNYQLQRLASRMRDGTSVPAETELSRVLTAWFVQTPRKESLETRFLRAAKAGVASLP
jgi:DNA repair protein SbcC/Rad50